MGEEANQEAEAQAAPDASALQVAVQSASSCSKQLCSRPAAAPSSCAAGPQLLKVAGSQSTASARQQPAHEPIGNCESSPIRNSGSYSLCLLYMSLLRLSFIL